MNALARSILAVLAFAATAPAIAQSESGVTVYGGYRFGGYFTDVNTEKKWELTDGGSFALAVNLGIDARTQYELFVSHRRSALKPSGFAPAVDGFGLDVTYYHVGGTYFFDRVGQGAYLAGGLGLTRFVPHSEGLSSETKFSINLGMGYLIPLGKHLGIKLEARGFGTLVDSSGGMFCSGGCVVQIKGSTLTQGEVLAGLTARF